MRLSAYIYSYVSGHALCMAAALLCMLFTGCQRRPLEDPEYFTKVNVEVNIDDLQNVTCDIYNPKVQVPAIEPEAMHAIFFNASDGSVTTETFLSGISVNEKGRRVVSGEMALLPGTYKMLIYDYGTDATLVKDYYSWDNAVAYTDHAPDIVLKQYASKSEGDGIEIFQEPEHLMVARNPQEKVPYHIGVHTIYAEARSVVESWYLQIKVNGIDYVSGAQAMITGMTGSNLIATDTRVNQPETGLWFRLQKSDDNGVPVICAVFNTFGHIESSESRLDITVLLNTSDGKKVARTFDISKLFRSENAVLHHWLLLDETITIDPPIEGGSGYNPKVDDWDEEHRDIDL